MSEWEIHSPPLTVENSEEPSPVSWLGAHCWSKGRPLSRPKPRRVSEQQAVLVYPFFFRKYAVWYCTVAHCLHPSNTLILSRFASEVISSAEPGKRTVRGRFSVRRGPSYGVGVETPSASSRFGPEKPGLRLVRCVSRVAPFLVATFFKAAHTAEPHFIAGVFTRSSSHSD